MSTTKESLVLKLKSLPFGSIEYCKILAEWKQLDAVKKPVFKVIRGEVVISKGKVLPESEITQAASRLEAQEACNILNVSFGKSVYFVR